MVAPPMTTDAEPVRREHVERAVEVLDAVEDPSALAALAYDVLSSQAEGRTLLAGKALADKKAEAHGVDRESAETPGGNLLVVLERGAKTPSERALVAAFAVRGLGAALAEADDERAQVFRFVRHADWLEVCTEYSIYRFVDRALDEMPAALVWTELSQRIVDEAAGRDGERPAVRARNAARLTALAASDSDAAKAALREVVESPALDEATRLLASTLAGDGVGEGAAVSTRVAGRLGRAPRRGAIEVVRWVSGWAIVSWLARAVAFLLGVRSSAELRLADGTVEVKTHWSMFGRTVREGEETWKLDAVDGAGRRVRYPMIHLLVGALGVSVGVIFGALVLFDGVRSGELILILIAAGLVAVGAGLDLALDVLVPAQRGRVVLDVAARSRQPLRLTQVAIDDADAFLRALRNAAARR